MIVLSFLLLILEISEGARILGVIPTASYSHHITFQTFWKELSQRGHQVTVMTTNPMKDSSLTNLTEIDLSFIYDIFRKYNFSEIFSDDGKSPMEKGQVITAMLAETDDFLFGHPQVQSLIHGKDVKFDLVIVEAQTPGVMVFSWRFSCPMIGISSLDAEMFYHLAMGNTVHPIANPNYNLPFNSPETLTFKERINSALHYMLYSSYLSYILYPQVYTKLKSVFGDDVPHPYVLHDNMVLLFINTNPIFNTIRPLNPNTIPIGGGIHLKEPKPLPRDIENYMNNANMGVIYFSLGTNVNAKMMSESMPIILEALSELPYKTLLKADRKIGNVSENIAIYKWLPQQDILCHPNLKLFITQGGLQSLQEAVYHAVPVIGIPFMGDQVTNVNIMVHQGYGIKLDRKDITKKTLKEAIIEIISNAKYRERVQELSAIYRDEEMPSLQKAIWWSEYVIRHKDGQHLRNSVAQMPFWKYYMLDIIGLIIFILVLLTFICYRVTKFICRKLFVTWNSSKCKTQ